MRGVVLVVTLCLAVTPAAAREPALHMYVLDAEEAAPPLSARADGETVPELHMTILPEANAPAVQDTATPVPRREERPTPYRFTYSMGLGWRRDDLDWTLRGGGTKALSEEKWRNLDSFRLSGGAHIVTPVRLTFQGGIAYSWILSGRQRRSDFLGDRRNREFSRIGGDADRGHGLEISAGLGYRLPLWDGLFRAWLEPLAGYGYRERNLDIDDPDQALATPGLTPPQGRMRATAYRYRARWRGPWLGLQLGLAGDRWQVYGQGEYHFARYRADGRWKHLGGRDRKIEFRQDGDGYGIVAGLGGSYRFWDRLSLGLSLDFQHWKTKRGNDVTVLEDGHRIHNRLEKASWRSLGGSLRLRYDF